MQLVKKKGLISKACTLLAGCLLTASIFAQPVGDSSAPAKAPTLHPTYQPHQVLDVGNGTKVEVLKSRGEGLAEECDVIYYTTKRQLGKRMWQSVVHLQEEERAARLAMEAAHPELKKTTSTPVPTAFNTTIFIPKPSLREQANVADSMAKRRAKVIERDILIAANEEKDKVYIPRVDSGKTILASSVAERDSAHPRVSSAEEPISLDEVKDKITMHVQSQVKQEPPKQDEGETEERFVKQYDKPSVTTAVPATTSTSQPSTNPDPPGTVPHPAAKEEPKDTAKPFEYAEGVITFPAAPKEEYKTEIIQSFQLININIDNSKVSVKQGIPVPDRNTHPLPALLYMTGPLSYPQQFSAKVDGASVAVRRSRVVQVKQQPTITAKSTDVFPVSAFVTQPLFNILIDSKGVQVKQVKLAAVKRLKAIAPATYNTTAIGDPAILQVSIDGSTVRTIKPSVQSYATSAVRTNAFWFVRIDNASIKVNRLKQTKEEIQKQPKQVVIAAAPVVSAPTYRTTAIIDPEIYKVDVNITGIAINAAPRPKTVAKIVTPIEQSTVKTPLPYVTSPVILDKFVTVKIDTTRVVLNKAIAPALASTPVIKSQVVITTPQTDASITPVASDHTSITTPSESTLSEIKNEVMLAQASAAKPSNSNDLVKIAEVKVNDNWEKAIVLDRDGEYLYKVHFPSRGDSSDEWVTATQIRNIDTVRRSSLVNATSHNVSEAKPTKKTAKAECSFAEPLPPIRESDSFSDDVAKRKIFEAIRAAYQKEKVRVGVTFLSVKKQQPYVNEASFSAGEIVLTYKPAPAGARIYPVKVRYKLCTQTAGDNLSTVEEKIYSCFRGKSGVWECVKDE